MAKPTSKKPSSSKPTETAAAGGAAARPREQTRYTLASLIPHAVHVNAVIRNLLVRGRKEESLVTLGARIDSANILGAIPGFFGSVIEIYGELTQAQQDLLTGYSPVLNAILADEALKLEKRKQAFDASGHKGAATRVHSRTAARDAMTKGIAVRDQAATIVRPFLGEDADVAALKQQKGTAETYQSLATGLGAIATLIEDQRKSGPDMAEAMDELKLTAAYVAELRQTARTVEETGKAAEAATPEPRVSQRQLDLQDGVVLHFVTIIYRAFRAGRKRDGSILLPKLGAMAPVVVGYARASKEDEAPVEPPAGENGEDDGDDEG